MDADSEPTMSDPSISAFLTQLLCAHGGRLAVAELPRHLSLPPAHIASILREEASRFRLLEHPAVVLLQTPVRLCPREQCQAPDCGRLHFCRFFILGTCYRSRRGNVCPYPHEVYSEANKAVLKANKLNYLDEKELRVLLLLNDPSFLPEVCKDYQGDLKAGTCPNGSQCKKLHVCRYFLQGQCSMSPCRGSHNLLDPSALRVMEARRLSKEMSQNIQLMRFHQCIEAQNAARNKNFKGDSARNLDLRGAVNPFFPLFSLTGRCAVPQGTALLNGIPEIHQPVTQVPIGCYSLFPPASVPTHAIGAAQPNRSEAQVGQSHSLLGFYTAGPASTPNSGSPQTSQLEVKREKKQKTPLDRRPTRESQFGTTEGATGQQANRPRLKSILKNPTPAPQIGPFKSNSSLDPTVDIQPANAADVSQTNASLPAAAPEDLGDPNEICLYHIWKFCRKLNKCAQMHYYLPYRWQVLEESGEWKDLTSMEDIEKAYSDPNNTSTKDHNIDFQKMTFSLKPIQRLSTASSVTKPSDYILTTEWVWYWKNESGQWVEYGKHGGKDKATVASADLESIYLADKNTVLQFEAGSQKYKINFEDMVQINVAFGTKREVLRRPWFVSLEDVKRLKTRVNQPMSASQAIPAYWDQTAIPSVGYKLVDINSNSLEFREIQREFEKTMAGYSIQEIKRIQNPSLWQAYQMQLKKMKTLNKEKNVLEEKLFHRASTCHVDEVCRENFDWRTYEFRADLYGQGSYFSKDAAYSHKYCQSSSNIKTIFWARVLVGDFVTGHASYTRPPPKPSNPRQAYDSCVDNEQNPSIFVIFEKHQHYPDYVLEYTEDKPQRITQELSLPQRKVLTQVQSQPKATTKKEDKKCCIS